MRRSILVKLLFILAANFRTESIEPTSNVSQINLPLSFLESISLLMVSCVDLGSRTPNQIITINDQ